MKGVGRLIQNEVMKITHQLGWKIIAVIILVLAIINPLVTYFINNLSFGSDEGYRENYENAQDGSIEKEYFGVLADVSDYFDENNIGIENWRRQMYSNSYKEEYLVLRGMELIESGRDPQEIDKLFFESDIDSTFDRGDYNIILSDDQNDKETIITPDTVSELIRQQKEIVADIEDQIVNSTVESYAQVYLTTFSLQKDIEEEEFSAASEAYKNDPSAIFDYQAASYDLYAVQTACDIWTAIKNGSREDEDWLLRTGELLYSYVDQGKNYAAVNEDDFNSDESLKDNYGDYDVYYKLKDKELHDRIAALEILKYSVENGIPVAAVYDLSSRNILSEGVTNNIEMILLFCMVLMATVIASEYSSGSIRLLIIRPRARWKILLSKICAVEIYGAVMFVLSYIVSMIVTFIVAGVGDTFVPVLLYRYGEVKEFSSVLYIVAKAMYAALPMLFFVSMAFVLAVLMRKVVFAIAIPMALYTFSSVVTLIIGIFGITGAKILRWTLLPYFATDGFTMDVVSRTMGFYMTYDYIGLGYEPEHGLIMFLAYIALFVALSFVIFRRQEIKN